MVTAKMRNALIAEKMILVLDIESYNIIISIAIYFVD